MCIRDRNELEGGVDVHGEKSIMTSSELIRLLESSYSIKPIADHNPAGMYFDFPLDVENSDIVSDIFLAIRNPASN